MAAYPHSLLSPKDPFFFDIISYNLIFYGLKHPSAALPHSPPLLLAAL